MLMQTPQIQICKFKLSLDPKDLTNYNQIIKTVTLDSKERNLDALDDLLTNIERRVLGKRSGNLYNELNELMQAIKCKGKLHNDPQASGSDIQIVIPAGALQNNSSYPLFFTREESLTTKIQENKKTKKKDKGQRARFGSRSGKVNKNDILSCTLDDVSKKTYLEIEVPRKHHEYLKFNGKELLFEVFKIPGWKVGDKLTKKQIENYFHNFLFTQKYEKSKRVGKNVQNMMNAYLFGWIKKFDVGVDY